jgi:hypothetical protein
LIDEQVAPLVHGKFLDAQMTGDEQAVAFRISS